MTKPVLLAGLLGGAVGAILCFALIRTFPPVVNPPPAAVPTPAPDGRAFADDIIDKLKANKHDELKPLVRLAFRELPDDQFDQSVWEPFLALRKMFAEAYGRSLNIEFARANVVSDDIARFTYIERFEHGCIVWVLACYNGPAGWRLVGFRHLKVDAAFEFLK